MTSYKKFKYDIQRVKPNQWDKIKKEVLKIENNVFNPPLRLSEKHLQKSFTNPTSISHVVRIKTGEMIGYSCSVIKKCNEYSSWKEDDSLSKKELIIWLDSIVVLKEHRRKGIGKNLVNALIKESRSKGIHIIGGHFLPDSQKLMKSFGAKTFFEHKHFLGSSKTAKYMELVIK